MSLRNDKFGLNLSSTESLDANFAFIANEYLEKIQSKEWSDSDKELLKFKNIEQLIITLEKVKPKSLIREEKRILITYLEKLIEISDNDFTRKDLILLRKNYIISILTYKLDEYNFRIAGGWIYWLLSTFPVAIIINYFFKEATIFYIPILSIIAIVVSIRKDLIAKRNHRLW